MKKLNNLIIIGCSIPALYAALKCIDLGYKVTIIEKKSTFISNAEIVYRNYNIYNNNHKTYISLLKRFDIKAKKLNVTFDEKFCVIVNNIIQKIKLIPNSILVSQTLLNLCKHLITDAEFDALNEYENSFNGIFNVINALDFIHIFTNDLCSNTTYYYLSDDQINLLISKMTELFISKNGKIIYNNEVKSIRYLKKKYVLVTNLHNTFTSDLLLTTISKNNLLSFTFWNNDQKINLNAVTAINSLIFKNIMDKLIFNIDSQDDKNITNVRQILLTDMHIVYPYYSNKSKYVFIWNNGSNNILIREKIKTMYNDKFIICSESYSKNNMFINYSLEYIDSALIKLYKYI